MVVTNNVKRIDRVRTTADIVGALGGLMLDHIAPKNEFGKLRVVIHGMADNGKTFSFERNYFYTVLGVAPFAAVTLLQPLDAAEEYYDATLAGVSVTVGSFSNGVGSHITVTVNGIGGRTLFVDSFCEIILNSVNTA